MSLNYLLAALIILPLLGSLLCFTCSKKIVGYLATAMVFLSFIFGILAASPVFNDFNTQEVITYTNWFQFREVPINFSLLWDSLSVVMVMMITGIGSLIHLYSIAYMSHDEHPQRYFAYLNLFIFFMLILVLAENYLMMFIGWEGVGLCSYLLIGFWYQNLEFAEAGKKAFIFNRIGDAGLLVAMFLMLYAYGDLSFLGLETHVGSANQVFPYVIVLGLFLAVAGKSAQLPLHVWLPDAMAGPTPVSALIHAATMVTAGIYLLVRSAFFLEANVGMLELRTLLFYIFLATSMIAGISAIFQNDLKKILAYSTVSQLGLMLMAVVVGAYQVAMFHVFTHAFFKAGLFLSAGNVIHALDGQQDIHNMGGLWKKIPTTFIVYLICVLSIAAIYPFSGFFSKTAIFYVVENNPFTNHLMAACALLGVLTAVYMVRSFYFVFLAPAKKGLSVHLPKKLDACLLNLPIIVLGLGAAFVGIFYQEFFFDFLGHLSLSRDFGTPEYSAGEAFLKSLKPLGVMIGLIVFWIFLPKLKFPKSLSFIPSRGFCFDCLYSFLIVKPLKFLAGVLEGFFEGAVISNTVSSFAALVQVGGKCCSALANGQIHSYLKFVILGVVFILFLVT